MTTYININGEVRDAASLNMPKDRAFRGAWQFNGDAVEIDMAKAKDIQRNKIRAERADKFPALDAEWFLADEAEDTAKKAEIAARKKALRDVTVDPRIESAKTPDDLSKLTLEALTK